VLESQNILLEENKIILPLFPVYLCLQTDSHNVNVLAF